MDFIRNGIATFPLEVVQEDEGSLPKVTMLAMITWDIQQQVEEMQARKMPRISLEVLEERRRAVSEAANKIREGESLCTKSVDVVAIIWGVFLTNETTDKISQSVRQVDEKISTL